MANPAKTTSAPLDRNAWLAGLEEARRTEAERVLDLFLQETGWEPRLWGPSIIGFGRYLYRYESGHGGESLVVGFSPRKAEFALYGLMGGEVAEALLPQLGTFRAGTGCIYIKRLAEVDEATLRGLIRAGVAEIAARWGVHPL